MRFTLISATLLCIGATVNAVGFLDTCVADPPSVENQTVFWNGNCKNTAGTMTKVHFDLNKCFAAGDDNIGNLSVRVLEFVNKSH
jgi:hypothetical protein